MAAQDYIEEMKYEHLIRNTFNCPRGSRNGADVCYMQNAMTMERGETFAKHLGSFDKQFNLVKNYISKALIKLTKTKPFSKEIDFFEELQHRLEYSSSTSDLMKIVDLALDKVIELKDI